MDKRKRSKKCSVCGDSAVGFNFGAIACESCKAFFRRSAHKAQMTSCLFNERCTVDVPTRRFCSHCRLKKCFSVGMKPSLILDEKAKRERREKIAHNRLTRSGVRSNPPADLIATKAPQLPPPPPLSVQLQPPNVNSKSDPAEILNPFLPLAPDAPVMDTGTESSHSIGETFDQMLSPAASCTGLPLSGTNTTDHWRALFDSSQSDGLPQMADTNEQMYCRGSLSTSSSYSQNSTEFPTEPSTITPPNCMPYTSSILKTCCAPYAQNRCTFGSSFPKDDMSRLLSHYQWTAIHDLRHAYETNFVEEESCSNLKRSDLTLSGLVNTSRFLVRRLINFAKTLADFSQLKQDCQINLLKGVVLSTLFLLSARHYDVEKDVWLTPKGEVSTQILKVATGTTDFYEEHTKYCREFNALVAQDSNLVALMQALCLFTPDRPALDARQAVANVHDRYYLLLKHYLEAKVGFTQGRALLAAVLNNLGQLETLTMNYGHMLMQLDPTKVDPLLMEIFNLTPNDPSNAHSRPIP